MYFNISIDKLLNFLLLCTRIEEGRDLLIKRLELCLIKLLMPIRKSYFELIHMFLIAFIIILLMLGSVLNKYNIIFIPHTVVVFLLNFIVIGLIIFYIYACIVKITGLLNRYIFTLITSTFISSSLIYIQYFKFDFVSLLLCVVYLIFLIGILTLKKIQDMMDCWYVCIHESGHAVVAEIEAPNSIREITIKIHNNKFEGLAEIDNFCDGSAENYIKQIRIFIAGGMAPAILVKTDIQHRADGDIELLKDTCKEYVNAGHCNIKIRNKKIKKWDSINSEMQQIVYLNIIQAEIDITKELVKSNKIKIMKVAETLYRKKKQDNILTIGCDEILKIIRQV